MILILSLIVGSKILKKQFLNIDFRLGYSGKPIIEYGGIIMNENFMTESEIETKVEKNNISIPKPHATHVY